MKILKTSAWTLSVVALTIGLSMFARAQTLHFSTDRLASSLPYEPEWEFQNSSEIDSILSQPFYYFNKGGQSWVFVSQDGRWVIKFFDFRLSWRDLAIKLHMPKFLVPEFTARQLQSRQGPVNAYALAFERFREPCGLIGSFLNGKQSGITKVTITSPIHCKHTIDLHQSCFVIQKKADATLPEQLEKLLKSGKTKEASEALSKTLTLIASRCYAGIADGDHWHLHRNIGFIGNEPIYLDAGTFRDDPSLLAPQATEAEILRSADLLIKKITKT